MDCSSEPLMVFPVGVPSRFRSLAVVESPSDTGKLARAIGSVGELNSVAGGVNRRGDTGLGGVDRVQHVADRIERTLREVDACRGPGGVLDGESS